MQGDYPGEEVLLRTRPAFRSFFVFYLGIALCTGGPLLKEDSPLSPWVGFFLSAIFLIIIVRRMSNRYILTNRRLRVNGGIFIQDTTEIALEDIEEIEANQGLTLRLMGAGHLLLHSRKPDQANIILYGLLDPMNFKKRLKKLALELSTLPA